ncbi:MAG: hypothetical protein Q9191_006288 [Dirinaria sp. TL-2023a]
MATPPRTPSPHVNRLSKSPSPFNPPNLPPLSAHVAREAAAMGSPTSPPPPTPPPKEEGSTQASQPTQHHSRPGTPDFFFRNSTYSMPGAYPDSRSHPPSPLAADPRTHAPETDIPYSPQRVPPSSGKRGSSGSSIRNLLSSLRRPSSQSPRTRVSEDSFGGNSSLRPDTPGRDSTASSTRPSLRKKMSGTFWSRRKSSLSMGAGFGTGDQERNERVNSDLGPEAPPNGHSTSPEQVKASKRGDTSESSSIVNSLRKKRSSTFWTTKRKSSLGNELNQSAAATDSQPDYQGHAGITPTGSGPSPVDQSDSEPLRSKKSGTFWPRKLSMTLQRETENTQKHYDHGGHSARDEIPKATGDEAELISDRKMSEAESYVPVPRSPSPPPTLPELNLNGYGSRGGSILGDGDDLFKGIGKD